MAAIHARPVMHKKFGTAARRAVFAAFAKLDPRQAVRNPVMFVVWLGSLVVTASLFFSFNLFDLQISIWLWFTVLFANFAEALAEGRGKAHADELRRTRTNLTARRLDDGGERVVPASDLAIGDRFVCEAGDTIPADGEVVEGIAVVDESAITGESAPVIRESGGDRSAVTGGTRVVSDRIVVATTTMPGNSFLDRMITMIESAKRKKTPNEIALGILLVMLTLLFLVAVGTIPAFVSYLETRGAAGAVALSPIVLVSLLVCLIPTTISGLLSAIGISGIDRLMRRNVIAMSGRAVEAAGDIDVLLLDKTGTITVGSRMATELFAAPGVTDERLAEAACLASLADETPEGRSIVVLVDARHGPGTRRPLPEATTLIPFTAQTRMSGVDIATADGKRMLRKGAIGAISEHVEEQGGRMPEALAKTADLIAGQGGTPLAVADGNRVLGVIRLKDVVKPGIVERFARLRKMGVRTIMVTGDNALTAAAIAAESGVDDFVAQATPEDKIACIRREQAQGRLVAMAGDGTNDAPALAQSDVGVAMNTGTQAAREAGNMVDLDSDPTKLIEIIEIGKQLLITRGALTTFSVANDVAKYFAILPAIFGALYASADGSAGPLAALNILGLHSPASAILAAVIFNALVIIALVPLALGGVGYRPLGAAALLRRNMLVYGLGGIVAPFAGIKLLDLALVAFGLVA